MDMAERNGSALRRLLASAERFNDAAISFGSSSTNTPFLRVSARECSSHPEASPLTSCQPLDVLSGTRFANSGLRLEY